MAQLNDLIVNGYSRFLNSAYGNLNGSATSALCAAYAASTNTAIKVNSATSATSAYDVINKAIKVNSAGSAEKAASATSALSAGSAAKAAELTNTAIQVASATSSNKTVSAYVSNNDNSDAYYGPIWANTATGTAGLRTTSAKFVFNPASGILRVTTVSATSVTGVTTSGTTIKGVTVSGTNITAATTVRGTNISGTNISGSSKTMTIDNLINSATRTIPTVNDNTITISTGASPATGSFTLNQNSNKTITLGSMALKASGDFSTTSHAHGNMESTFVKTLPNTTSTTWSSQFGVLNNGFWLYSIRAQGTVPAWFAAGYGAGIAFGGSDTKGVVSMDWNTPYIKFASGPGNTSAGEPKWWFGFSGTAGKKYTLPGADSTLAATTGSYSGTNGLTALSARGAYSASNAATAGDSNKLGGTAAGSFALQDGNYSSMGLVAKSASTAAYATSAGAAPVASHQFSSHTNFSTYFNGTSANSALTSKSALSAGSAKNAEWASSADYLGGYAAGSFALQDGNYSSVGGLTAKSARGAYSASTANYSNSTNTAIKVNSAIYLQDFSDGAYSVRLSWKSPDIAKVTPTATSWTINDTNCMAAWMVSGGVPVIKAVNAKNVWVNSANNADTVDGLHVATGTIGSATNYLYFC